jgi:hypothetical protein
LLNEWTYVNTAITVYDFKEQEAGELLAMQAVAEKDKQ